MFPSSKSTNRSFKRYSSNCFPCNSSRGRSRFLSGTAIRNDETEVCRWQGGQRFRHHRRFEYHEEMKRTSRKGSSYNGNVDFCGFTELSRVIHDRRIELCTGKIWNDCSWISSLLLNYLSARKKFSMMK